MAGETKAQQPALGAELPPTSSAGLMALIADVERQLSSLREADAQRRVAEEQLVSREASLVAREAELQTSTVASAALRESLDAERTELEQQRRELDERDASLRAQSESLAAERAELERELERVAELEARSLEREREAATIRQEAELQAQNARTMAEEAEARRSQMERSLAERTLVFRTAEERIEQRVTEIESLLENSQRDCALHEARVAELTTELEGRIAEMHTLQSRAQDAGQVAGLKDQLRAREEAINDLRSQLAESIKAAQEASAALERATAELDRTRRDADEKARVIAARNEELKSLRAQAAGLREKGTSDASVKGQLAQLTTELSTRASELESLRAEHAELLARFEQESSAHAQADAQIQSYLTHIASIEGELADARRAPGASSNSSSSPSASAVQTDADALRAQIASLEEARDESEAEITKLRDYAKTLAQELKAARQLAQRGSGALPGTASADPDLSVATLTLRRQRLRHQRSMLKAQSVKIRRAADAFRERYEQVDQLLAQRAEIIAARKIVENTQRKLRSKQARASAVGAIFYAALSLLIFSGLGWLAAGEIAPATYAAVATIEADASGRPLSAAELHEWQRYHEDLLVDPRTLDEIATRMKQRGLASLATPHMLKARLDTDLSAEASNAGFLTLELRGIGMERTVRELETLVTTFVRQANTARERRVDGSTTIISAAASSNGNPLTDERIYYAAAIAGGLSMLSFIVGWILWRKLYDAKASMEASDEVDPFLDERRWQAPARPNT